LPVASASTPDAIFHLGEILVLPNDEYQRMDIAAGTERKSGTDYSDQAGKIVPPSRAHAIHDRLISTSKERQPLQTRLVNQWDNALNFTPQR